MLTLPHPQNSWEYKGKLRPLVSRPSHGSALPTLHHGTQQKELNQSNTSVLSIETLGWWWRTWFLVYYNPPIIPHPPLLKWQVTYKIHQSLTASSQSTRHDYWSASQVPLPIQISMSNHQLGRVCVSINYEYQALSACHCHG